jgi:hypothetical protein
MTLRTVPTVDNEGTESLWWQMEATSDSISRSPLSGIEDGKAWPLFNMIFEPERFPLAHSIRRN